MGCRLGQSKSPLSSSARVIKSSIELLGNSDGKKDLEAPDDARYKKLREKNETL